MRGSCGHRPDQGVCLPDLSFQLRGIPLDPEPFRAPVIGAEQAVLVLGAYFMVLIVIAAGLLRLRDV